MTIQAIIQHLKKSPIDAWYYVQGYVRFDIYESSLKEIFLRKHIVEQVEWRRDKKANVCYMNGSCKCCGCDTPALFFSNKGCSAGSIKYPHCALMGLKQCYPAMMNKKEWTEYKDK